MIKEEEKMNYVYDLLLNFKEDYYEFYDWNIKDVLEHIRRIPIFKVTTKTMADFLNYDVHVKKEFLEIVDNQTEIFLGRRIKKEKYAFLITDSRKVLAIKVKDNKIYISDLLIDEQEVALELVPLLSLIEIDYEIEGINKKQKFKTRKEIEFEKYLDKEFQNLIKEENEDKLKYIYYECFDKKQESREIIIKEIEKELRVNFHNFSKKLDHLLKLTQRTI